MHTVRQHALCYTFRKLSKLYELWNDRVKTLTANLLRDWFRSPGHVPFNCPESTTTPSEKSPDVHVSSLAQTLDLRLAFTDFRLDPHCSLVFNHTILLELLLLLLLLHHLCPAPTTSNEHVPPTREPCDHGNGLVERVCLMFVRLQQRLNFKMTKS